MWKDRIITVIGATAGLAQETVEELAEAGAALVLHGRDPQKLEDTAKRCKEEAVVTVQGEVQDPALAGRIWEAVQELQSQNPQRVPFGFACFVGVPGRIPPDQWTAAALAEVFAINCAGPLLLCKHWCQQMKEAGLPGNAVLFSTMQAQYPFEGSLSYSLGKAALEHGIRILAKEMGGPPMQRINGIAPGVHEAGMALSSIRRGKYAPYLDDHRIPRYGQPADMRRAIEFLLGPDLYMTGQTLLLDGGLTLRRDL